MWGVICIARIRIRNLLICYILVCVLLLFCRYGLLLKTKRLQPGMRLCWKQYRKSRLCLYRVGARVMLCLCLIQCSRLESKYQTKMPMLVENRRSISSGKRFPAHDILKLSGNSSMNWLSWHSLFCLIQEMPLRISLLVKPQQMPLLDSDTYSKFLVHSTSRS